MFIAQRVFRCVTVWRTVTAPGRTAPLAGAQMNPGRTKLHALVTLTDLRQSYRLDLPDVNASIIRHDFEPLLSQPAGQLAFLLHQIGSKLELYQLGCGFAW